jgi:prolyl-tRNA synthetase
VSGYAANVEKCEIGSRPSDLNGAPTGDLAEVHTPDLPGIDDVGKFMGVKPARMLKTIVFQALEPRHDAAARPGDPVKWIVAVVRGDHDANEGKVKAASGYTVALADEKAAKAAGFAIGYVSPRTINTVPGTLMLIDPDAAQGGFWATGADKKDHHAKHFNWRRDVGPRLDDQNYVKVADVRNALAGDPSPRSPGAKLETGRGIEVGHIFKLGSKYSDAMGFSILDQNQQKRSVVMGCYGIGVSRTMAACVEMSHDQDGIIWPAPIAPYHVLITLLKPDNADHAREAERLAASLAERGADVLIDDRDERPGVKFKDADLIGVPVRLTIGDKALAEGAVEFKQRKAPGKGELVPLDAAVERCLTALAG